MLAVITKHTKIGIIKNLNYLYYLYNYFPLFSKLTIWGSPPWLAMNTVDCEMAENKNITVFKKDFLNYESAETFLSS